MPDLPHQHNPRPRTPWQKGTNAPNRVTGRKLQRINERIKQRDSHTCQNKSCNRVTAQLVIDHIIPLSEGGQDTDANKQSLCIPCHDEKSKAERERARKRVDVI